MVFLVWPTQILLHICMLHVDLCENLKKHLLGVQALGEEFTTSYVQLQMEQWRSYSRHLSQWELDNTLDC
jgi:glutamine synthetase